MNLMGKLAKKLLVMEMLELIMVVLPRADGNVVGDGSRTDGMIQWS